MGTRDNAYQRKIAPYTPDSQRTISYNFVAHTRRGSNYSKSWKPIQIVLDPEEELLRKIKGKAPMTAISSSGYKENHGLYNTKTKPKPLSIREPHTVHCPSTASINTMINEVQQKSPAISASVINAGKVPEKIQENVQESPVQMAERIAALEEDGMIIMEPKMIDAET